MNKTRILGVLILAVCSAIVVFIVVFMKQKDLDINSEKLISLEQVKNGYEDELQSARKGRYKNLVIHDFSYSMESIAEIRQFVLMENRSYESRSGLENLDKVMQAIEAYYGDVWKEMPTELCAFDLEGEAKIFNIDEFKAQMLDSDTDFQKYFTIYGEAEGKSERFVQIDSAFSIVWFSNGNLEGRLPSAHYDTVKVYNPTFSEKEMEESVELVSGQNVTLNDAVAYVEGYLNENLPFEHNTQWYYEVAEVRILDVEGKNALCMKIRRNYNGIPFDYGDSVTTGEYISMYLDEIGEVTITSLDGVDNFFGLAGTMDQISPDEEGYEKIISLDTALRLLSESIGDNSVYDIYGIEIVYQLQDLREYDENGLLIESESDEKARGVPKWKILARNQNDSKDTWFYVDMLTGEITYRYKKIIDGE